MGVLVVGPFRNPLVHSGSFTAAEQMKEMVADGCYGDRLQRPSSSVGQEVYLHLQLHLSGIPGKYG